MPISNVMANEVDSDWYLETYPDVAASGTSPQAHYEKYGRVEGRLPRLLAARALDVKLWGGFSGIALPEMKTLNCNAASGSEEGRYSAWALARWYACREEWANAAAFIDGMTSPRPQGHTLLHIEILLRLGRVGEAQNVLLAAIGQQGPLPDLCLAAANVAAYTETREIIGKQQLNWINHLFSRAGLARISKAEPTLQLGLDNLAAVELPSLSNPLPTKKRKKTAATMRLPAQPKVSVIMPAYNAASFIHTALNSLLSQSWTNLEVIVVDDCSSDDTASIVSAVAAKDPRIALVCLPHNGGAYAARNVGLQHTSGDYITNHDSDDWSHPQRLERLAGALSDEPTCVGVMAHWVRCDGAMHFQRWHMENSLIHPTVSTLMFRREILARVGGWDEVKVGADTELWQRIVAMYGPGAVKEVLPGVPLAFGRQLPESLTSATATHLSSRYFGLRRLYQELSQSWHASAATSDALYLSKNSDQRRYLPPSAVSKNFSTAQSYDWVLMADFGEYAPVFAQTQSLMKQRLADGQRIALFHWPDYRQPLPALIAEFFLSLAVQGAVDILLPSQPVSTELLEVLGRHLLEHPLDAIPQVRFRRCRVLDQEKAKQTVRLLRPRDGLQDRRLIEQSGLFCADWYLHRYPDVRKAGVDPLRHYLDHGAAEGRDPGPAFNTLHYLAQLTQGVGSSSSPLSHYLTVGAGLGYTRVAQDRSGNRPAHRDWPTLLLCGHASSEQLFGAERSLLDVLEALSKLTVNVMVTVPSDVNPGYISAIQKHVHAVLIVPCPLWSAESEPCPWAQERFAGIIREYDVDAVQVNTIMLREPLLAGRQQNIPTLVHVRESPERDTDLCRAIGLSAEAIREQVLLRADHVLANSAFTAQAFNKPGTTHLVGNALNPANFDVPNRINSGMINIALISSNLPKKGLADLVAIAQMLEVSTPAARVLLIGPENEYFDALRNEHALGNLPANLVLTGYESTPLEAIQQANIVLNLSHFQETFGRTVLEAMASRRPVLAYAQGALPELIQEGVNGFLFPFGDVHAVATKLQWLCRNPKQIEKLGTAGRRIAVAKFSLSRMEKELEGVYLPLLKKTAAHIGPLIKIKDLIADS